MWWKRSPLGGLLALAASVGALGCGSASLRESLRAADAALAPLPGAAGKAAAPPAPHGVGGVPARPALGDAELAGPLDLQAVERAVIERRPSLIAAAERARAIASRAAAEGALPAPEAMLDLWQIPFAKPYALDKAGMIMMSIRQEIPPAGMKELAAQAMALEARAGAAMVTAEARMLLKDVDRTFADYVEATLLHEAHVGHRRIVEQMAAAARARYAGGGPLADITKADLELARMAADVAREHGRIDEARAQLNGFLARPAGAALGPPRLEDPVSIALTADQVIAEALAKSPEVLAADLMERSAQTSVQAADREAKVPTFTVGVSTFLPVNDMPFGYGTSFAMSLPWVWGAGPKQVDAAKHRANAERASAAEARLKVRASVDTALAAVRGAEHLYLVLRDRVRPAAQRALDAAQAGYATSGTDLLSWLDAERSSLDVEADLASARAGLARALADLDWAAGEHVPRAPLSADRETNHEP